jgi:hypothetical protein
MGRMKAIRCREGEYAESRSPVVRSVHDIPERLKEVADSLFVMYNRDSGRYEVHDRDQDGGTLACVLPFDELDYRALEYVRERHVARFDKLAKEIDQHNDKLEETAYRRYMSVANDKMKDAMMWAWHHEDADKLPDEMLGGEGS